MMKTKNIFFIMLIALSAFSLAGVGAWFSVYGLTKIFAAGWLTFILFGSLEFSKIVVVSFVYRFWRITKTFQKFYLILATIVLMSITSIGIYGFLTNSYQKTSSIDKLNQSEIKIYEMKKERFEENRVYYISEKESIDQSITNLREGLSNNKIQYTDTLGRIITTTSINTRKALQIQLEDAVERRNEISIKLENVSDSLGFYDRKIFELESRNEASNELGPLKYLGELTNTPMDKVVNWLALLIIFVFDPLAIMLIVSLNQLMLHSGYDPFKGTKSYNKLKVKEKTEEKEEKVEEKVEEKDEEKEEEKLKEEVQEKVEENINDTFLADSFKKIEGLILSKNEDNELFKNDVNDQIMNLKNDINYKLLEQHDDKFQESVIEQFNKIEEKIRSFDNNMEKVILSSNNDKFNDDVIEKIGILSDKLKEMSNDDFKEKIKEQIDIIMNKLKNNSDFEKLKNEIGEISNKINDNSDIDELKNEINNISNRISKSNKVVEHKPKVEGVTNVGSINKAHFSKK